MSKFTGSDLKLLSILQDDLSLSRQEMADAVGTSASTLWRRVNELEVSGVIEKRVALLSPEKSGLPICVFLSVNLVNYDSQTRESFHRFVQATPEVMECFSVTGAHDYILIVRSASVADFEQFLTGAVLGHAAVASASSQISIKQHKYTTALPLSAAQ